MLQIIVFLHGMNEPMIIQRLSGMGNTVDCMRQDNALSGKFESEKNSQLFTPALHHQSYRIRRLRLAVCFFKNCDNNLHFNIDTIVIIVHNRNE